MEKTKRLVHDLSKCYDIEHFIKHYDLVFLREELKDLSENREYIYTPAKEMLIELNQLKLLGQS